MVFEGVVDVVVDLVLVVGLPVLIVLFYLEGIVVGKILQAPAVFVTVVAITQPPWGVIALLCGACAISVVAGQWTIFRSFDDGAAPLFGLRRRFPVLRKLPTMAVERIGEKRFSIIERLFERYGGMAILVTTFLPGVRGLLAIPAGMSSYPVRRFLAVTVIGNVLYFPVLVAVAFGILQLLGLR